MNLRLECRNILRHRGGLRLENCYVPDAGDAVPGVDKMSAFEYQIVARQGRCVSMMSRSRAVASPAAACARKSLRVVVIG